jgi:hypothetical protein
MRRSCLVLCLLAIAAAAISAQPYVLLGAGASFMAQDTDARQPWNAASAGVMVQSLVDVTPNLGIYSAAAIGFVFASRDNGTALDVGQYQTLGLDLLFGIGYRLDLGAVTGVAAAGFYVGSKTLNASDSSLASFAAGGVGGGIGIAVLYSLSESWGIGGNVNAAYYFGIPGNSAPTMAPSGFGLFGGVGVAYFFRARPILAPGLSPY